MGRKGISLSMTYVVLGLIMLTTAATVILYLTGNIESVKGITEGQISESRRQLIANQCLAQKTQICSDPSVTGTAWASEASYKGKPCAEWASQNNVFGPEGTIPRC